MAFKSNSMKSKGQLFTHTLLVYPFMKFYGMSGSNKMWVNKMLFEITDGGRNSIFNMVCPFITRFEAVFFLFLPAMKRVMVFVRLVY